MGDRWEDRTEGRREGRLEDLKAGRSGDRTEGHSGDRTEGRLEDRKAGRSEDRTEGLEGRKADLKGDHWGVRKEVHSAAQEVAPQEVGWEAKVSAASTAGQRRVLDRWRAV